MSGAVMIELRVGWSVRALHADAGIGGADWMDFRNQEVKMVRGGIWSLVPEWSLCTFDSWI